MLKQTKDVVTSRGQADRLTHSLDAYWKHAGWYIFQNEKVLCSWIGRSSLYIVLMMLSWFYLTNFLSVS